MSPPRRVSIALPIVIFCLVCVYQNETGYKLIMSVQPTAGVKTGDEFVDSVASGDGEVYAAITDPFAAQHPICVDFDRSSDRGNKQI